MKKYFISSSVALLISMALAVPCAGKTHRRNNNSDLASNPLSLLHENHMAAQDGLERIFDDTELDLLKKRGALVRIPENKKIVLDISPDADVTKKFRWCRPWTLHFLFAIADAHYAKFHKEIRVTSAVRTVAYQQSLRKVNPNAAPVDGSQASTHLTGATIDIGKKEMTPREILWFRTYLRNAQSQQKIHIIEEFYQQTFHIMVRKTPIP